MNPRTITVTTWLNLTASAYRPASARPARRASATRSTKLSAYSDSSAGIVGRPKRSIGRSRAREGTSARRARWIHEQRGEDERGAAEVAEQQPARALVLDHHQPDGERDREQHVREAGGEVGARPLVEAEQRHHQLVEREHPQPAGRDQHQLRVAPVEQRLRQRPGERGDEQRADA